MLTYKAKVAKYSGNLKEAEELYKRVLEGRKKKLTSDDLQMASIHYKLAFC